MSGEIQLQVENLSKKYKLYAAPIHRMKEALHPFKKKYHREFYALKDINFEVQKGESVGIVGKNGAGKSTLLKIITGVLTPTYGSVNVSGRIAALLELGTGFHLDYSGIENVYLFGSYLGLTRAEMNRKIDEILAFADIGEYIYQPMKTYSSGMYARLAFAAAIHVEPDILIVDEVLSVGDTNFQMKCHKKMDKLRDNGVTILFVSHDTYSVKTMCSTAVFLERGQQMSFGPALKIVNDYLLHMDNKQKEQIELAQEITEHGHSELLPAKINRVVTLNQQSQEAKTIQITTGSDLLVQVEYEILSKNIDNVVFVFNLYRERDNVYVCGTTSLMDGVEPIKVGQGKHIFKFLLPSLPLLSGKYRMRVAINEKKGLGIIAEIKDALFIDVIDSQESEGLINLPRQWVLS